MRQGGYGLTIDSAFDIPGAIACAETGPADLIIAKGDADLAPGGAMLGAYRRAGSQLMLEVPAVGGFRMDGPSALTVAPDRTADPADVAALLIASALPMILWRRGGMVLHASGVKLRGGTSAVALVGESGSGKSTLARLLVQRGAALVGDDSLWLTDDPAGSRQVSGLAGGVFIGQGAETRRFEPFVPAHAGPTRLAAVVVLTRSAAAGIVRLDPLPAVAALLRHRHRPNIPALLGLDALVLALCTRIAGHLPVYAMGLIDGDPLAATKAIAQIPTG